MQSYVSRVRFVEACAAVPADALLLEVGPHALLRSPLRQNRATLPCATCSLRFTLKRKPKAGQAVRDVSRPLQALPGRGADKTLAQLWQQHGPVHVSHALTFMVDADSGRACAGM